MATTFCCGFECGVAGAHWTLGGGTQSFTTSSPITGARSLRCNPTVNTGYAQTVANFGAGLFVYRYKIRFATLPSADSYLDGNTSTTLGAYFKQSESKIYAAALAAPPSLGATGISVTTGVTYYIDVRINTTANPWLCDVRVNGVACGQASSAQGAVTIAAGLIIGVTSAITADIIYDDIVLSTTTGDFPIGDGYVNHFVPTSDGAHNVAGTGDFQRTLTGTDILNATTTAFQLVDDVPLESGASVDWINMLAPPNATDYVECKFGPAPGILIPTTAPRAVEVIAGIHQATTATGNMEIRLNDNGTMGTVYTATTVAGVTSVAYKRAHFADPPSAAPVWNVFNDGSNGDFLDLRVRFGSPAALDVVPDQYFDCIMIEAEFPANQPAALYSRPMGQRGESQMSQLLAQ